MNTVKWGVLGTANIAAGCTIPGMQLADNCELYAIAGRSIEKAEDYKERFGFDKAYGSYEELLDDENVEAVYIPLPNDLHCEWVIKALNKKKNVLCEKPIALNKAEAEKMYKAAKDNNVILMEAFAYLHSPYVKSLKKDIESGIIGDIDYIETAFLTQGYTDDIRIRKAQGGGAMYDLGCYCTTMILSLIDSEVIDVRAVAEFAPTDVDCLTSAILRFKNGARASFDVGMILGIDHNARMDRLYIHGSKGTIISDVEYNMQGDVSYMINTRGGTEIRKITVPQNYSLEIAQMGRCITEGEKPYVSEKFSLKNLGLMDEILKKIGY